MVFSILALSVIVCLTEEGCLAWFTNRKNSESRITNVKILFSRILKISNVIFSLTCSWALSTLIRFQTKTELFCSVFKKFSLVHTTTPYPF